MKKIIQINVTCGRGSTGKLAQSLYEGSVNAGFEARFAYAEFTPTIPEAFRIETNMQCVLRKARNRLFGRKQSHSKAGTKRLLRYLDQEKPDLVHLHNIHHNATCYPMLFSYLKEKKIPTVFTLHDCWAFTGGCYYFTRKHCEGYKTGCTDCLLPCQRDDVAFVAAEGYQRRKDLMADNGDLYPVCVSKWLRDVALESYMGNMKNPPQTIYNGIDTELFSPKESCIRQKFGIPEDCFVVLGVAAYWSEDRKGLPLLLNLRKKLPQDAVLVLVGGDLDSVKGKYENLVCIERTENQEQLAQLYSTADVFVNSSPEETFGMTTAEALACGTPAVVFDSTACPEIVDENTGIIAENTAESVLQAVLEIKDKGKDAYSNHCVERVRACFGEDRMVEEYLALYRRVLDGK